MCATQRSKKAYVGNICHILPLQETKGRSSAGLTKKELNHYDNLVLLCRHHHAIVDCQYESYPPGQLRRWKRQHEEKIRERLAASPGGLDEALFSHPSFPIELVDSRIEHDLLCLRSSRFFAEFDTSGFSLRFAEALAEGHLSFGSNSARCRALSWCARLLARNNQIERAESFLQRARRLADAIESRIAAAFIESARATKSLRSRNWLGRRKRLRGQLLWRSFSPRKDLRLRSIGAERPV